MFEIDALVGKYTWLASEITFAIGHRKAGKAIDAKQGGGTEAKGQFHERFSMG